MYDKPYLTYDERIEKLKNEKRLGIDNIDLAKRILKTIPYYNLINGYKDIFMENDIYLDNVSIEYLYAFHLFDRNVQNTLFKYTVFVENQFKNHLSNYISKEFGVSVDEYLDPQHYSHRRAINELRNLAINCEHNPTT